MEFILYIYMTIDNYDGGFFRYRDRLTNAAMIAKLSKMYLQFKVRI